MPKKRIRLVDDSRIVVMIEQMILAKGPYDLLVARDGQEGVERALAERPDLILMDLVMPRLTGFEALTRLRAPTRRRGTSP